MNLRENKLLRIGIVCYPTRGGSGVVAVDLAHALAARGHEVHLISYAQPPRLDSLRYGVTFHSVNVPDYPLFEYPPYDLALAARLAEVMVEHNLDILHVHYAIPHAISGILAREMSKRMTIPVITTLHGTDITIVGNDPSYLPITRYSLEKSDVITVVSHWLGEQVAQVLKSGCQCKVIYNFVDSEKFHPRKENPLKRCCAGLNKPILMHLSNFRPVKHIDVVVDVFLEVHRHLPVSLVMVGDGPLKEPAKRRLRESPYPEDAHFIGVQDAAEEILPGADLFLFPSKAESFGLAALEAMACGVPVIGTNVGGLPEVVEDGVSGLLFAPGDVEGMANACLELLTDRIKMNSMRENARKWAIERFSSDSAITQYLEVYFQAIEKKGEQP